MTSYRVSLSNLSEFAQALASTIESGDVLGLNGGLGAGKTTLIKRLCRQWGVDSDEVTSPTYVYHHQYEGNHLIDHMDLYRLEDPLSLDQLGLSECLDSPSVVLVEWMNKFPHFASTYMQINITILSENERQLDVTWVDYPLLRIEQFCKALAPWEVGT